MAQVVLLQKCLDVFHVGGGVDILGAPLLPGLPPLAGEQQHGGALALQHRLADGLAPVGDDAAAGFALFHVGANFVADVQSILLPAVLLGEVDPVTPGAGGLAQIVAAVVGLLARAAEHDGQLPLGVLGPDGGKEGLKAQAVVGVVHNGQHPPVGVGVHLHATGHPRPHQSVVHCPLRDVQSLAQGGGSQGVFHVKEARHGQPHLAGVPGGAQSKEDLPVLLVYVAGVHLGGGVLLGEGNDGRSGGLGGLHHPLGVVTVQVHAADVGLGKDLQLGGKVVLKVGVLDGGNVVVADVEKARGGKLGAQGAVVFQRLAGYLHGHILQPGLGGVGKVALEVQRLRGGEVRLKALHAVVGVDGGDNAGLPSPLALLVAVQDGLHIVGGGRLALGAGDADDLQLAGGMVVEPVGQRGQHLSGVGNGDAGQAGDGVLLLADAGHGALIPGHLQKLSLKVGALADEEGAGGHLPGVAGEAGDALVPVQAVRDGGGKQVLLREQVQVVSQSMDRDGHNRHLRGIIFRKWCAEACGTPRWSVGPAPPWRPRRRRTGGAHWQRRTVRCRPARRSRSPAPPGPW